MNFGWKFLDDYEELGMGIGGGWRGKEKERGKGKGKGETWEYTSRSRYMINALDFKTSSLFSLLLNSQFRISTKSLVGYHHLTVVSNRRRHTCRRTYLTPILSRARTSGIAILYLLVARIFEKRLKDWFCPAISVSTSDFRYDTETFNPPAAILFGLMVYCSILGILILLRTQLSVATV